MEEAKYQAQKRTEAIEKAKTQLYYQSDRIKAFHVSSTAKAPPFVALCSLVASSICRRRRRTVCGAGIECHIILSAFIIR